MDSRLLTAIGKHGYLAKLSVITAILNVVLSLILVHTLGLVGVAIGSEVSAMAYMPLTLVFCCRELSISLMDYVRCVFKPVIVPTLFLVGTITLLAAENISKYAEIVFLVLAGSVAYCVVGVFTIFTPQERSWMLYRLSFKKLR